MAITVRPRLGRPRYPRRRINRRFLARLAETDRSLDVLAAVAGYPAPPHLCAALRAEEIPAGPRTVRRFHRLADALGYPRDQVFEALR